MEMGGTSCRRSNNSVFMIQLLLLLIMFLSVCEAKVIDQSSFNGGGGGEEEECDIYKGKWVLSDGNDQQFYDSSSCPFIRKEFDCQKYGRPDSFYLNFTWKPSSNKCNLPRFDGEDFLKRFEGKKIMFVGDSLSLNFWQSLICLLHAALPPQSNITRETKDSFSTVTFQDYGLSVMIFHSLYLVDVENEEQLGRVLNLNSIKDGDTWKNMDVLIFNTWLWWGRRGIKQPWDYIQLGGKMYKDMNRMLAFHLGLTTWAKWVNTEVDPVKTKVFFQGISPSHYSFEVSLLVEQTANGYFTSGYVEFARLRGEDWNEPGVTSCSNETIPLMGEAYPSGLPEATKVVDKVLKTISSTSSSKNNNIVTLLNITTLSQMRKDSHPSSYNAFKGMDCTHWCIPGLPDTWSQLLYAELIS